MPTHKPQACPCGKQPYKNKQAAEKAYGQTDRCGRCRMWKPGKRGGRK